MSFAVACLVLAIQKGQLGMLPAESYDPRVGANIKRFKAYYTEAWGSITPN